MNPITVAVVGTGTMAAAMIEDLRRCPETEPITVVSRTVDRARAFADQQGIPDALELDDMDRAGADVVYVATPHDSHAEIAVAALAGGAHVLVEKAFTVNADEARRVLAAAAQYDRFCMEAMWMRFNPVIRRVQELLAEGAIGDPRTVQASFGRAVPYDRAHRLWDPERGGGSLLDQGVYPLTLADLVLGEPQTVHAVGSYRGYDGSDGGVDTEVAVLLGYGDGRQATTASSIRTALPRGAWIGGREGLIRLDEPFWCASGFTLERPGREPERVELAIEGRGYVPMLRAVHEAVSQGWSEHPTIPWAATLRVMALLDEVRAQLSREPATS